MTSTLAPSLDRRELARDLRALGLPSEQTYLVHSSLRQIGTLADGPQGLLDAFRDSCGDRSTIVTPAFTAGNSTTTRAYRRRTDGMTPEQLLDEEDKIAGFDRRTSPSQNVGMFSECVRTAPGSVRSNHPQTSFCAVGPQACELVAVHALDCHLGEQSPLSRLYDNDAVVVLIGVGFAVCTCFHLAEYRLAEPVDVRPYRTFLMTGGRRKPHDFFAPDTDDRDFATIGNEMAEKPFVHTGQLGQAPVHWFRMRDGVDFAVDWMNRFR